ncbi:hypothetical protein BDC45DRAFT_532877 [Circinella umbellata]|nr:hypothetical protein BDC45DRAFT_532877 [Circinella umbellata]
MYHNCIRIFLLFFLLVLQFLYVRWDRDKDYRFLFQLVFDLVILIKFLDGLMVDTVLDMDKNVILGNLYEMFRLSGIIWFRLLSKIMFPQYRYGNIMLHLVRSVLYSSNGYFVRSSFE